MFRLARVLRWKERVEREALVRRATVEAALRELADAGARLRGERSGLPDREETDLASLVGWAGYADGLRRREERIRRRMDELRPRVNEAIRAHVAARREVEGLRKLEEREVRRRRRRFERRQQELLDDAAARPFLPGGGTEFPVAGGGNEAAAERERAETARKRGTAPKRETEA